MHCIMARVANAPHAQPESWGVGAGCDQDAVASPPMRSPAEAVFLASAMKLRAAKNSETQVKAIASGTTIVIAD
jgi:hypothetical protein